jgi:hypothetical protein
MIHLPTRIDLIQLIPPGAIVAEIGVRRGEFSLEFLKRPIGKLLLVDAWTQEPGPDSCSNEEHADNYNQMRHNLRGHWMGGRVQVIKGYSADVARDPKTPMLDAIYLDACHSYESVVEDLELWSKKLKPQGVIYGHDLTDSPPAKALNFGVCAAVEEFCKTHGYEITHVTDEDFPSYRLAKL